MSKACPFCNGTGTIAGVNSTLKVGTTVKLANPPQEGTITGAYMTPDGVAFTVKTNPASVVDRNVLLKDMTETVDPAPAPK